MKPFNRNKKQEKEKLGSSRKALPKPWTLQYQWQSHEDFDKYSWQSQRMFNSDWKPHFSKYTDPDHAKHQLEKELRGWFGDRMFKGRNWRIFNKETQQNLAVKIEDKTITLT